MTNKFKYVRMKNPKLKAGKMVLHEGDLMRVSSADGDTVILRREKRIHPLCESLMEERTKCLEAAVDLMNSGIEMVISNGGDIWQPYEHYTQAEREEVAWIMRELVADLRRKMNHLDVGGE